MIPLHPDTNLRELVARAFELSRPQGMGLFHHRPGPATEEEISSCVKHAGTEAVASDYLRGRSMKLYVFRTPGGGLEVDDHWYDHPDASWNELLAPYRAA